MTDRVCQSFSLRVSGKLGGLTSTCGGKSSVDCLYIRSIRYTRPCSLGNCTILDRHCESHLMSYRSSTINLRDTLLKDVPKKR